MIIQTASKQGLKAQLTTLYNHHYTLRKLSQVSSTESGPAVNSGEGPDETEQSSPSEEEWRSSEQDNMESGLAAGCHDIDNCDDNNIDAYSSGDDGDGGNSTEMSLDTLTLEMEVQ